MNALDELLKNIDYSAFGYTAGLRIADDATAELAQLRADLDEANENLLSMVNQYCCRTVRKDGTPLTYSHDFMSAGEQAFEYLVQHGLAKWCENGVDIYDLRFPSVHKG